MSQLKQLKMFGDAGAQMPGPHLPTQPNYYNTTKLSDEELKQAQTNAQYQAQLILGLYKKYSPMSPSTCWGLFKSQYGEILLTSCRRAITTLTKRGFLTKTSIQVKSPYNAKEFVWKIS